MEVPWTFDQTVRGRTFDFCPDDVDSGGGRGFVRYFPWTPSWTGRVVSTVHVRGSPSGGRVVETGVITYNNSTGTLVG